MKIGTPKIVTIAISVLVIVGIFIAVVFFTQKNEKLVVESVESTELIIEPIELNLEMNNSAQVRAYLLDLDSGEKEDVTNQTEWTINNPEIATIGNKSVKGQIIANEKGGEVVITATYNNQIANALVKITRPELEVECAARIMRDDGPVFEDTAKVGEIIHWVGGYNKWGAPNYIYKWTGTDNLDDNAATAIKTYDTPGLKEVNFFTEDTAGTIAEAICSITIIK